MQDMLIMFKQKVLIAKQNTENMVTQEQNTRKYSNRTPENIGTETGTVSKNDKTLSFLLTVRTCQKQKDNRQISRDET